MIQDQSLIVLGLRQDARPSIEESGSRVDGLIDRLQAKSLARIRSGEPPSCNHLIRPEQVAPRL
jgi:hypothetical protein